MNYRLQTRKKSRNPIPKIAIIIVICLILGFFARGLIVRTFVGTSGVLNSVLSFIMPNGFRSDSLIKEENDMLRQEVLRLTSENADRMVLKNENDGLKFLLNRDVKKDGVKGTLAVVLSKPATTPYDTFILDAGSKLGVEVNDNVTFGSLIIGSITEVGTSFSKAKLFSSFGNVFSGTLGKDNLKIEVKGLGGGTFESLVPIGASVEVGDALVIPQIESRVYGVVQKIEELSDEGFKKLFFVMPVNLNQINDVIIQN